ncbi:MAG: tripartite tricarboxylate transporter TctB family protein [Fusobacterium gastrosuis]|uniref:tripartite tricarboxylate transporter TctB family protein n=1 Tax=Fusobacterium gastrosuis TaxID=1755100 RepID=UPI002AA024F4|nr:tripartite tricarboxylate transporter TctB family protein [Fusobacteriaceae bacterium]MDY5795044.1 tripartite tricarboxylate transporter TctB family protein [Fusobacterium gastrosuis]
MNNKTRDIICSIIFLLTGLFLFQQSLEIKSIMEKDLGSGFMPKVIAVSLVAIAVLKLVLSIVKKDSENKSSKEDSDSMGGLLTIGALLFYVLTFEIIGFILSTALYLFFQITILSNQENRKLGLFLIISVGFSVAIYGLFVYLIDRPLPIGILGF